MWGIGFTVVILAAVLVARFFIGARPPADLSPLTNEHKTERTIREGRRAGQIEAGRQQSPPATLAPPPAKEPSQPTAELQKPAVRPDQSQTRQSRGAPAAQPEEEHKPESSSKADEGALSATEWFERGKNLNDDSDVEIHCYQKALELDRELSPAHFRLGAIYYRRGDYELAEQEFARFLKYASEADKVAYNIHLYYSPEYLKRVVEEEAPVGAPTKEFGKEAVKKAEKPGAETKEGARELQTIVQFSTSNGQMVVPVLLNDAIEARVVFDTGAEMTVLSKKTAEGLGLRLGSQRPVRLQTIAAPIQAPVATLNSLQCGGMRRTNLPVAVVDFDLGRQVEGILGMDFLGNYTISIESESSQIVLKPRATSNP